VINLDYLLLSLKTDKTAVIGSSSISGLLSSEYQKFFPQNKPEKSRSGDSKETGCHFEYFYPRLQYKIVRGSPMIAAINEGCNLLWDIYDKLDEVSTNQTEWKITEKRLIEKKAPFGLCSDSIKYRFLTPWLALDEDNLKKYIMLDDNLKERMLARILESHLDSISKSLGYNFKDDLKIRLNIKSQYFFLRDIHVAGLFGSFTANFEIPNFLGIGKSVSRGYGTIKRI
jgi:hypothetical protein